MPYKHVTAREKKQYHEEAIRQIDAGMSLSELTANTTETWACSRRHAQDVIAKAHANWERCSMTKTSTRVVYFLESWPLRVNCPQSRKFMAILCHIGGDNGTKPNDGIGR